MNKQADVIELDNKSEYQRLLAGVPETFGLKAGKVYLKPGESCGEHSTESREEILVFLSGRGQALIGADNKSFEVGQGKIAYIPPHTIHNIKNTASEALIYIFAVTPVQDE